MAPFSSTDKLYLLVTLFYLAAMTVFLFRQKKIAFFLLLAGFGLHTFFLWNRAWISGFLISTALFESIYFLPWCVALLAIGLKAFAKAKSLTHSTLMLIFPLTLLAFFSPGGSSPHHPKPKLFFLPFFSFSRFWPRPVLFSAPG